MDIFKDMFGIDIKDSRNEYEKSIDEEFEILLKKYEKRFNDELSTETLPMNTEQLIKDLKRCLKEGITLDVIYPGINKYNY